MSIVCVGETNRRGDRNRLGEKLKRSGVTGCWERTSLTLGGGLGGRGKRASTGGAQRETESVEEEEGWLRVREVGG